MLIRVDELSGLNLGRFFAVYEEGIRENAAEFYPEDEPMEAVRKEETSFLEFLKRFFSKPGSTYWILAEDGVWVSALRLSVVEEGFYYLEALETRPDSRKRGYASKLLNGVIECLKRQGPFRICDCVNKRNLPSVRTHERCGFSIVSEIGHDYTSGRDAVWEYGFEYHYAGEEEGEIKWQK